MKTLAQAFLDAADWLENNRDRHIVGRAAVDSTGNLCEPSNPDAQCFCAIGRIAKELELEKLGDNYEGVADLLPPWLTAGNIYGPNDSLYGERRGRPVCPDQVPAGDRVIGALRAWAKVMQA